MERKTVESNIAWNTVGNIFYLGCQWLLSVVVVRVTGSYADAGTLALAISISSIFTILALFSVRNYQVSDITGQYSQSDYVSHRIITCSAAMLLCIVFTMIIGYSLGTTLSIIAYLLMRLVEAGCLSRYLANTVEAGYCRKILHLSWSRAVALIYSGI